MLHCYDWPTKYNENLFVYCDIIINIPDESYRNTDTTIFSRSHTGMTKELVEGKLNKKGLQK